MLRPIVCIFFLIGIISVSGMSQSTANDSLSIKDGFWGLSHLKGSREISTKEFEQLLRSHPDQSIYELYSSGDNQSTIAQIFAFGGGFCIGYGLTTKPTNTTLAAVGAVVAIAGFVIDNGGRNKMNEALSKYNNTIPPLQSVHPPVSDVPNTLVAFSFAF